MHSIKYNQCVACAQIYKFVGIKSQMQCKRYLYFRANDFARDRFLIAFIVQFDKQWRFVKNKFAHKSVAACSAVAYSGFIRRGPINESLLIQREIYFHPLPLRPCAVRRVVYEVYVRTRTRRRACHGNENKVRRNGQGSVGPRAIIFPWSNEGSLRLCSPCIACKLLYIHRDAVYVAIELSHTPPWYFVYLDARREINYAK